MTAALDLIPAVRDLLLADGTISGLVSDRVYDSEIPEGASGGMPQDAIVLNAAGGSAYPGSGRQHYGTTRVDVFAYGETLKKSRQLYLAVYAALKFMGAGQTREGVLLKSATVQSKGITGRDPERQWPLTLSSWLILAAETDG